MKKILLLVLVSLFVSPLFVFAGWCENVGGHMETVNGTDVCYCPDGTIESGDCSGHMESNNVYVPDVEPTPLVPNTNTDTNNNTNGNTNTNTGTSTVGSSSGVISNPISSSTFEDLIKMITQWILNIAMVLAPLVIVYGGFTYITAAGDPGKMEIGKKIIIYAVLGFILALLASSLVDIFKTFVGGVK